MFGQEEYVILRFGFTSTSGEKGTVDHCMAKAALRSDSGPFILVSITTSERVHT